MGFYTFLSQIAMIDSGFGGKDLSPKIAKKKILRNILEILHPKHLRFTVWWDLLWHYSSPNFHYSGVNGAQVPTGILGASLMKHCKKEVEPCFENVRQLTASWPFSTCSPKLRHLSNSCLNLKMSFFTKGHVPRETNQFTMFCDLSWISSLKMIFWVSEWLTPWSLSASLALNRIRLKRMLNLPSKQKSTFFWY